MYRSTDNMSTWTLVNTGITQYPAYRITAILEFNNKLFIATEDGIYKLAADGNSWIKKSNGLELGNGATHLFTESLFSTGSRLITGAYSGIYYSLDSGENWVLSNTSGMHVLAKGFALHDGKLYAARETNNTPLGFTSLDSGLTWNPISGIGFPSITFFSEPGKLWAGTIHGALLSTNNGVSWVSRINGFSADPYCSAFLRWNGILFTTLTAGGSGVFATVDEGLHWIDVGSNDGLPFISEISEMQIFNGFFILSTTGGLYKRSSDEFTKKIFVHAGWNIISTPLIPVLKSTAELFPGATSQLFGYNGGYIAEDTIISGRGYWLRFPAHDSISVHGIPDSIKLIPLEQGWNLIGVKINPVPVSSITTLPAGILASDFFGFSNGYLNTLQLEGGKGYWIKSSSTGAIKLP